MYRKTVLTQVFKKPIQPPNAFTLHAGLLEWTLNKFGKTSG
ncbi:MAG: hypothetical protein KatS3mg104_1674 [Phycisphaerae bacterium]|nr:MAG: hypothetical protein KatS3mg104_1674 [Phycisphaerae bacterium]